MAAKWRRSAKGKTRSFHKENRCFSLLFGRLMYFEFTGVWYGATWGRLSASGRAGALRDWRTGFLWRGQNFCRHPQISCSPVVPSCRPLSLPSPHQRDYRTVLPSPPPSAQSILMFGHRSELNRRN